MDARRVTGLSCVSLLLAGGILARADFQAFNDLQWNSGELTSNITTNSPTASTSGALKDYGSGSTLSATVSITSNGLVQSTANTMTVPGGSDADLAFSGKTTLDSYSFLNQSVVTLTFSGLDQNAAYSFVLYGSRGSGAETYSNRWADVAISDTSVYTNNSSSGLTKLTTSAANDTTRLVGANMNGMVVRFDGIKSGSDGDILLTLTPGGTGPFGTNAYINAFMLQEFGGGSTNGGGSGTNGYEWRQASATYNESSTSRNMYLYISNNLGKVYIDDLYFCAGSTPESGANLVANPGFESGTTSWNLTGGHSISAASSLYAHSGAQSLLLACSAPTFGGGGDSVNQAMSGMTIGQNYTISFWYLATGAVDFVERFSSMPSSACVISLDSTGTGQGTPSLPVIANNSPSILGPTSAQALGTLSSTGLVPTQVWLYYQAGSDSGTNKGSWGNTVSIGYSAAGSVGSTLSGLNSNTTYYYRFYASNSIGDAWGSPAQNFTTPSIVVTSTVSYAGADKRQLYASTRRTGFIISEIMYNPPSPYTNTLEYVEIFNSESSDEEIGGWTLSGDVDYTFPTNTLMPARTYWVIAKSPSLIQSQYGLSASVVKGPFTGSMANGSGTIRLKNELGAVMGETKYSSKWPWPAQADGAGHSLVLMKPDYGEGDDRAWGISSVRLGNPGTSNKTISASYSLKNVCINEFLAHTDPPQEDFIELYNGGTSAVDLIGCYISDSVKNLTKYQVPTSTVINAKGFVRFTATTLGFGLSMGGGSIYLVNPSFDVVLDAVKYETQENGVSEGRYPNGQPGFVELNAVTENASNNGTTMKAREIVINEIMFNPLSGDEDDEYIELYNKASTNVNVGNWRFTQGVDFTIPAGKTIAGNGFLVIAKNAEHLLARYTNLTANTVIGDFDGTLSDSGERVVLSMPDDPALPYQDFRVEDEVTYEDYWGQWTDQGGSSLELKDPRSDNNRGMNWAGSDETQKARWSTVEVFGNLDNEPGEYAVGWGGNNTWYLREIILGLNGKGECLLDDLHVTCGGTEYNINQDLNGGSSSWYFQGTYKQSAWESNTGTGSNGCVHVRAHGSIDPSINSISSRMNGGLSAGNNGVKISIKARWLCGNPALGMRLAGGGFWTCQTLDIPQLLGTPGATNSRAANAGPAIDNVLQSPALPAANQTVTFSARLHDPDGIQSASVRWRLDPSTTWTTQALNDNGTGGDTNANDGVWSGQIAGQSANAVVMYYIQATDSNASQKTTYFPSANGGLATNCEPSMIYGQSIANCGNYGALRIVWPPSLDQAASAGAYWMWDRMDNDLMPCTLVYNDCRVIYGAGTRLQSSVWSRPKPGCDLFGFPDDTFTRIQQSHHFGLPKGDKLCGASSFNFDSLNYLNRARQSAGGNPMGPQDPLFIRERLQHWVLQKMGLPSSHQRYWHLFANDFHKGIIHGDAILPNEGDMDAWVPSQPDGDLYEPKQWYETLKDTSDNNNSKQGEIATSPFRYFTHDDGSPRPEVYRVVLEKKVNDPFDTGNDSIVAVSRVLNTPVDSSAASQKAYVAKVGQVVDMEQWIRAFAFRQLLADGDSFPWNGGPNGGANRYFYCPKGGKALALEYGMDWGFGYEGGTTPGQNYTNSGILYTGCYVMSNNFLKCNAVLRGYWRGMRDELAIWDSPDFGKTITNLFNAHVANNIAYWKYLGRTAGNTSGDDGIMTQGSLDLLWSWIEGRKSYIRNNHLTTALTNISFTASGGGTTGSKSVTISGNAPIQARWLKVNNNIIPDADIGWTSTTAYQFDYVVTNAGNYSLAVIALDNKSNQVGSTQNLSVNYTGSQTSPSGQVVISEIMYDSPAARGGFIELYNRNASEGYDLDGLRMNGVDFTFPPNSYIGPQSYAVIVASSTTFSQQYTNLVKVLGEYSGSLDAGGERISLERPSIVGSVTNWIVVDTVRYDSTRPWPTEPRQTGYSLQLIDPAQDNDRVANWTTTRKWKRWSGTGTAGNQPMYFSVFNLGDVFIDDVKLVQGATAEVGTNIMVNGDFENGWPGPWVVGEAYRGSQVINGAAHHGSHCLRVKSSVSNTTGNLSIMQTTPVVGGQQYTLSFWYLPSSTGSTFQSRFSGSWIDTGTVQENMADAATPGRANVGTTTLSTIPTMWINELMPNNTASSGIKDNFNDSDPWLELYNTSGGSYDLVGGNYYLTDDYDNMTKWKFSTAQSISAGSRLAVWCDNETGENASSYPHSGFVLSHTNGSLALVQVNNSKTTVVDYVNYDMVPTNKSAGCYPEGDTSSRVLFDSPTAGTANNPTSIVVVLKINEWMANAKINSVTNDPHDGDFDDWFELYNPNPVAADVSGYSLTDDLSDTNKFVIPSGWSVPAHGFMLIWADNETGQNDPGYDVHANFKLSNTGGVIAVYAPDGHQVDQVTFGDQDSNISEGRYVDGGSTIYSMPIPTPKATNRLFEVSGAGAVSNGTFTLNWTSLPGREYQVVYVGTLGSTNWVVYGTNIPAGTGSTATLSVPVTGNVRFYRLWQK